MTVLEPLAPTTATGAGQEHSHTLTRIRTTYQYDVTGKPDTKGPGKGSVTVRPERVEVRFVDGKVSWVSVWGRTIRRDGTVTGYRDVGFDTRPFTQDGVHHTHNELPEWLEDLLDDEGIRWPNGHQPSQLDHDAAIADGVKALIEMMRAEDGDDFEEPDADDLTEIRSKMARLVAVVLPAAEGRGVTR